MPRRNHSTAQQPLSFGDPHDSARYWIRQTLERTRPAADVKHVQDVENILLEDAERYAIPIEKIVTWLTDETAIHTDAGWRAFCEQWLMEAGT